MLYWVRAEQGHRVPRSNARWACLPEIIAPAGGAPGFYVGQHSNIFGITLFFLFFYYAWMTRQYDSSRRKKAAEQIHPGILQAALKLHWEAITEFELLAEEAACLLATVRKHFPTEEALYRECAQASSHRLTRLDLTALEEIAEQKSAWREVSLNCAGVAKQC